MIAGRWLIALVSCLCWTAHAAPARVQVDLAQEKAISRDLMGVFFEDLNHAGDGGLYALYRSAELADDHSARALSNSASCAYSQAIACSDQSVVPLAITASRSD